MEDRKRAMLNTVSSDPIDLQLLYDHSRQEGGFLSSKIRARVWPKLLGINRYKVVDYKKYIRNHNEERQVRCDIDRSFWSLDCAANWGDRRMHRKRTDLSNIIVALLCKNSRYYYFQGFHDIVSILILVFNDNALAFCALESICQKYLSDFMKRDFSSLSKIMKLIMVLIRRADSELADFLDESGTEPYFATSWLITWMSHDIRNFQQASRMFDAILCSPPEYSFYLCASLVMMHREEILSLECDFSTVHNALSRLLKGDCRKDDMASFTCNVDLEGLIRFADGLMEDITPSDLLDMADESIRSVITNNKLILFNGRGMRRPPVVTPDHVLLKNLRLINMASINKYRNTIVFSGWISYFLCSGKCSSKHPTRSGSIVSRILVTSQSIKRRFVPKNNPHRFFLLAILGGVLSIGVWMCRHYIQNNKSLE